MPKLPRCYILLLSFFNTFQPCSLSWLGKEKPLRYLLLFSQSPPTIYSLPHSLRQTTIGPSWISEWIIWRVYLRVGEREICDQFEDSDWLFADLRGFFRDHRRYYVVLGKATTFYFLFFLLDLNPSVLYFSNGLERRCPVQGVSGRCWSDYHLWHQLPL